MCHLFITSKKITAMAKKESMLSLDPKRLEMIMAEKRLSPKQEEAKARKIEDSKKALEFLGVAKNDQVKKEVSDGLINPFALTETLLEAELNWRDPRSMDIMSRVLGANYEDLITSKDSILLAGRNLGGRKEVEIETVRSNTRGLESLEEIKKSLNDFDMPPLSDQELETKRQEYVSKLNLREKKEAVLSNTKLRKEIRDLVIPSSGRDTQSELPSFEVGFQGNIVHNKWDNVIQGGVGNCYFHAGLCAVAWAWPGLLNMDVDTLLTANADFADNWRLWKYFIGTTDHQTSSGVGVSKNRIYYFGTDAKRTGQAIFGHSRFGHNGEYWTGIMEQAYANWRFPNLRLDQAIMTTNGGWGETAALELTGDSTCTSERFWLYNISEANLRTYLFGNGSNIPSKFYGWKTITPMTLSAREDHTLQGIAYPHAYTLLGYTTYQGRTYLIIRNPWGYGEPSGQGVLSIRDWVKHFGRTTWFNFPLDDGIFALDISLVMSNFRYIGRVF